MRRLAALLLVVLAWLLLPIPQAPAQEPNVRLTLVSQTPWSSNRDRSLDIEVRASNLGDQAIRDLSIGWTLWSPVITRNEYERSLVADPENAVSIAGDSLPERGALQPGASRLFHLHLSMDSPGLSPTEPKVYPLKIDLRSGFTSLAAVRTPAIFLVRRPVVPLTLAWTFVLHEPIGFAPNGTFNSTSMEAALGPGGALAGEIRALLALTKARPGTPVDLAVSPVLLADLARMRAGYSVKEGTATRLVKAGTGGAAAAGQALADLRQIASSRQVRVSALPFSAPDLPALSAGGLFRDLAPQLERGRRAVGTALGRAPSATVLRPPDSSLDRPSLDQVASSGVRLLLLDPSVAPVPAGPLGFAPPATVSLATDRGPVTAIVADRSLQRLLESNMVQDDPVRAAQALVGELAQIWLEKPSIERGIALTLPEGFDAPASFFGPLVRGVGGAPWLRKQGLATMARTFPPTNDATLAGGAPASFPRSYVEAIKQARRRIAIYRSMLVAPSDEPDRLETMLLFAESGQFLPDQLAGLSFVGFASDVVGSVFGAVRPDAGQVITLTSRSGTGIPIAVSNDNDEPLRVIVRLLSSHLSSSPQTAMVLRPQSTRTVSFDVSLTTTGRFPVNVEVTSPNGTVIKTGTLIVRSTAYNRIALIITIGAAAVGLLVWARRFLPRRTS